MTTLISKRPGLHSRIEVEEDLRETAPVPMALMVLRSCCLATLA